VTDLLVRSEADRVGRDADGIELSLGHLVSRVDADRQGRLGEARDVLSACAQRLTLDA